MRRILSLATAALVAAALTGGQAGAVTFDVGTKADRGAGSLRAAMNKANARSGPDRITFAPSLSGRTIALASRLPAVTDRGGLTIDGGSTNIAVSGEDKVRVFEVASGAKLALDKLTVTKGLAPACTDFPCASPGGGILNFGTLALRGSTLSESSADVGGGIANEGGGTVSVNNSTISGNDAPLGGGGISSVGTLTVRRSTISGNVASGEGPGFGAGFGGGIQNLGTLSLEGSIISENSGKTGGGIFHSGFDGTLTVGTSTISGNVASGGGGGIWNNSTARVKNSTISGNVAAFGVGGIENKSTARVKNSTISENSTGVGGSVPPALKSTIVANSSSGVDCDGSINDLGHNLDSDASCVDAINSLPGVDPKLGPLADNGGPTPTHALLAGSPALGRGFSSNARSDQRGEERPGHAGCSDIGAVEEQDPRMQPPFLVKDDFYKPLEDTELRRDVLSNDCDSNVRPASVIPSSQGTTDGTLTRNVDGSFVYNPDADFFGKEAPFTYTVPGGEGAPSVGAVEITVQPVNDAPSFKKGANQSANQGSGEQKVPGWASDISPGGPANEGDQGVSFLTLIEDEDQKFFADTEVVPDGGLPRITDDGTLIYKPTTDTRINTGTVTVGVVAKDTGGTTNGGVEQSAPQTFEITINRVNATAP